VLDETSYINAIYVYVAAALFILLIFLRWLSRHWRPAWVALVVLLLAAWLLTPAYPREGVTTLAPALVVAVFQMLTTGVESAMHALRPLGLTTGIAVALALILKLLFFRKPAQPANPEQSAKPAAAEP